MAPDRAANLPRLAKPFEVVNMFAPRDDKYC